MDPEDALADWAARVERHSGLTTELSERLQQARATAESRGGHVVVAVDHSGGLADLRLTEQAMRLTPNDLGEVILATSRRAQAKLARQVTDVVNSLYGAGSETADFIGKAYSEQFPEPENEAEEREGR